MHVFKEDANTDTERASRAHVWVLQFTRRLQSFWCELVGQMSLIYNENNQTRWKPKAERTDFISLRLRSLDLFLWPYGHRRGGSCHVHCITSVHSWMWYGLRSYLTSAGL